jgi:hypothetical protein
MSNSSNPLFRLQADARFPAAMVTIFDGHYGILAEGVGSVEVEVAPGLYLVQFKAGQLFEKQTVDVSGHTVVVAKVFSLPAAPTEKLPFLAPSQEGQCRLFLSAEGERGAALLARLSILDALRNNVPLPAPSEPKISADLHLTVIPGQYLIRIEVEQGKSLEQTFFLPVGWQAQIFFRTDGSTILETDICRWMTNAVVILLPENFAFVASTRDREEMEVTLQNLASNQTIAMEVSAPERQKAVNPMLDLITAYALLSDRDTNPAFDRALQALRSTIPLHPDVVALEIFLDSTKFPTSMFDLPPMLRDSWRILVEESLARKSLLPASSWSALIANGLTGVRGWLVWRTPERDDKLLEPTEELSETLKDLRSKVSALAIGKTDLELRSIVRTLALKGVEGALLSYLLSVVRSEDTALELVNSLYSSSVVDSVYRFFHQLLPSVQLVPKETILVAAKNLIQTRSTELAVVRSLEVPQSTLECASASLSLKLGTVTNVPAIVANSA